MIRAEQSDVDDSYSPWLGVCEGAVRERNRRVPPSPKTILWWHLPAVDKIQGVKWAFTYAGRPLVFPAQVLILACFDPDDLACEEPEDVVEVAEPASVEDVGYLRMTTAMTMVIRCAHI